MTHSRTMAGRTGSSAWLMRLLEGVEEDPSFRHDLLTFYPSGVEREGWHDLGM